MKVSNGSYFNIWKHIDTRQFSRLENCGHWFMVKSNPANTNCVAAVLYPSPATRVGSISAWEDTGVVRLAQI